MAVDLTEEYAKSLELAGPCFSAWAGPELIAVAGVVEFWPGRAQVWALMSSRITEYGGLVHRRVVQYLKSYHVRRLECIIDPRFPDSSLWAVRLGFFFESKMKAYGFHGQDMDMYVKHG